MNTVYDNEAFFQAYSQMPRSREGLSGAGEWHQLQQLIPDLRGKAVLDLGCGYGWHCQYAAGQGASRVLGIDASRKMIEVAQQLHSAPQITYQVCDVETYSYPECTFDCVLSNLMLHYIADLDAVYHYVYKTLKSGGIFLFNIEHPVFTSGVGQDWVYQANGTPLYWPVDRYFDPGTRQTQFLGHPVLKQHHTLTQILMELLHAGFQLEAVEEAMPPEEMLTLPGMLDELRRPMMLLVKSRKQ